MEVCVIWGLELLIAPNFSQLPPFYTTFYLDTRKTLAPPQIYINQISYMTMFSFEDEKQNTSETRILKDKTQGKDILR